MCGGTEGQGQDSPTDEELLRRAANGDEVAFGEFCSRALPKLLNAFRQECRAYGAPESLVEDAIQSAIMEAIEYIRKATPSEITRGLLTVITRRSLFKLIRYERRQSLQVSANSIDVESFIDPLPMSVESMLIVREAFDSLPSTDQEILSSILFYRKSRDELAIELGISVSAISKRYYRAIFKLRQCLSGQEHLIQ